MIRLSKEGQGSLQGTVVILPSEEPSGSCSSCSCVLVPLLLVSPSTIGSGSVDTDGGGSGARRGGGERGGGIGDKEGDDGGGGDVLGK